MILLGTAEIPCMKLQRFIHEMMVATPLVVLLALGIQARTSPSDFEPYSYGPELQSRLLAYGDVLRFSEESGLRTGKQNRYDTYRKVAQEWIRRAEAGLLLELPAANSLDTVRDGAKAEVRSAVVNISNGLLRESEELPTHDVESRLQGLELSVKVLNLIRYSDHYAMGYAATRNQAWFDTLRPYVPRFNQAQLRRLEAALDEATPAPHRVSLMLARAEKQFIRDGRRWGYGRIGTLVPSASIHERERFDRQLQQLMRANGDDPAFTKQNGGVIYANSALECQEESLVALRRAILEQRSALSAAGYK